MDFELPLTIVSVTDESTPQFDGSLLRQRKYVIRIGKYGPFIERVPLENFDATAIGRRVEQLRGELRALQAL